MDKQKCDTCKKEKSLDCFYKNKSKKNGIASTCKLCATKLLDKHRKTSKFKRNALDRQREYRRKYPERNRAHQLAQYARKKGWIVTRNTCEDCGEKKRLEMAHIDYSRPLDIRWLCTPCHREFDKKII